MFILHKVPESLNHAGQRGDKLPTSNTSLHIDRHSKAYRASGKVSPNCANPQWRWKYQFSHITVKMVVRLSRIETYHSGKTHCRATGMRKYPLPIVSNPLWQPVHTEMTLAQTHPDVLLTFFSSQNSSSFTFHSTPIIWNQFIAIPSYYSKFSSWQL